MHERINLIFELTLTVMSFYIVFKGAAVVFAILANIPGLETKSLIICPKYLTFVTVSSLFPFAVTSLFMPVWHRLSFFGTNLYAVCCRGFVEIYKFAKLSRRCHQRSESRCLSRHQCWHHLGDFPRHRSWSSPERCSRECVLLDILVELQLLF